MTQDEIRKEFRIFSEAGRYNNHWNVQHIASGRIVKSSPSLREMLLWVDSWGYLALDAVQSSP